MQLKKVNAMKLTEFYKKHLLKEGHLVEFEYNSQKIKGTIIPTNDELLTVKLDSGYNAGFALENVKQLKVIGEAKTVSKPTPKLPTPNESLPKISLIHTGGTIAARVDYQRGAVSWHTTPEDLLSMYPELFSICNPKVVLLKSMATDDFRFEHFELITKAVEKEAKEGAEGIILAMGTDNLAVASAALAFIFEKISIPVIIIGSQRSSDRGSSDAAMNLISAAKFITKTDFAGIAICMHDSSNDDKCAILPACKTKKMHTSRRDAFKPINDTLIAKIDFRTGEIKFLKSNYIRRNLKEALVAKPKMEKKVAMMKISINMYPEQFALYKKLGMKGLIIEGTGLGHMPLDTIDKETEIHKEIKKELQALIDSGCIVAMTSTCLNGRVQMHVYSKQVELVNIGVIPGEDMLTETAFVKLAWLLGNYSKKEAKELLTKNLRGEISPFTRTDTYEY
jgi:glutamyl-tRNA(Gln) amidotransferase subunit D